MDLTSESQREVDEAEENRNLKKIEAALFISARFISVKELVELTDINPLMLKELLAKLKERYDGADTAIEIIHKEDLWKMDLRHEYFEMINKLATGNAEFTRAEQETLAIIAYKQPVKQSVIIKIRGNKAYEHIHNFIEMGLVRSKKAGHTVDLSLTEGFFDYFHLEKKEKEKAEPVKKEDSEEII
jgi:segregation and condensation protein B